MKEVISLIDFSGKMFIQMEVGILFQKKKDLIVSNKKIAHYSKSGKF